MTCAAEEAVIRAKAVATRHSPRPATADNRLMRGAAVRTLVDAEAVALCHRASRCAPAADAPGRHYQGSGNEGGRTAAGSGRRGDAGDGGPAGRLRRRRRWGRRQRRQCSDRGSGEGQVGGEDERRPVGGRRPRERGGRRSGPARNTPSPSSSRAPSSGPRGSRPTRQPASPWRTSGCARPNRRRPRRRPDPSARRRTRRPPTSLCTPMARPPTPKNPAPVRNAATNCTSYEDDMGLDPTVTALPDRDPDPADDAFACRRELAGTVHLVPGGAQRAPCGRLRLAEPGRAQEGGRGPGRGDRRAARKADGVGRHGPSPLLSAGRARNTIVLKWVGPASIRASACVLCRVPGERAEPANPAKRSRSANR